MTVTGHIARIAVPKPLWQLFDYLVPPNLRPPVIGARVKVPFGRQTLTGMCVGLDPEDAHQAPKPLSAVLDDHSVLGEELYELALWLASYYQHPLGEVLGTLLPAEARRGSELKIHRERAWRLRNSEGSVRRAPQQAALVAHLKQNAGCASHRALREAGFSQTVIRALAGKGLIVADETGDPDPVPRDKRSAIGRHALNPEQQAAIEQLQSGAAGFAPTLLEGVTGSGKTEIYMQFIEQVRTRGRQVLVLVPEIALTPQTLSRFTQRFGKASTMHSGMTDQQRLQTWLRCRSGEEGILIGTRSAVLTPFKDLGLIVVDEEHDGSFKQQEGLRYSARDVAVKRAQTLRIPLLLGSATPSFESLHNAQTGRYRHLELRHRAGGAAMPKFNLLDIRGHTLTDGVSDRLRRIIATHLDSRGQVLVFLNRRGFAPSYLCPGCGWMAICERCDMRMTLHRQPPALICHHCDHRARLPTECPTCGHGQLLAVGLGTQRTEAGLLNMFPDTPLYRIDRDTVRSQKRLEQSLDLINSGVPAILIGTQMLAKGHHFPNVTLVAIVNADAGFCSADFKAPERTAQLIVQVAGRAGRAERPGEVWIQTYQPENPILTALIREGYQGFAGREMATRHAAGLPPFRPMALLRAESREPKQALGFLETAKQTIRGRRGDGVEILGPAEAPIPKIADRYRYQLLVLADSRATLHRVLRASGDLQSAAPRLRWSLDIDPYDTF